MGEDVYRQAQDSAIASGLKGCFIGTPLGAGAGVALGIAGGPTGALTGGLIGAAGGCIVGAAKEMLSNSQRSFDSTPHIPTRLDSSAGRGL